MPLDLDSLDEDRVVYRITVYIDDEGDLCINGQGNFAEWNDTERIKAATIEAVKKLTEMLDQMPATNDVLH